MDLDKPDSAEYRTRKALCARAVELVGVPYVWGGQDPSYGLDCSGLIVECMRHAGLTEGDLTAQQLADGSERVSSIGIMPGDLVFYGRSWESVTHVVMVIAFERCVGASNGGSWCTTPDRARQKKAAVRIMDIDYRTRDRLGYGRIWDWGTK
jgi:hypothetical protein